MLSAAEAVENGSGKTTRIPVGAAQIQVLIPYQDLLDRTAASGLLVDGTPLSAGELRILACGADLLPTVLGTDSQILDFGDTIRLAPPWLRRAIGLRDGGCAFPGCTTPMRHCELHHVKPWQEGGPTDRNNTVALCKVHHTMCEPRPPTTGPDGQLIEQDGWDVRIDHRGLPEFIPPTALDPARTPIPRVGHAATLFDHDMHPRAG
ncbi:MAG: HNH endonuclease signature motif containing protein [Propionibacteriaceae bacterium]